MTAIIKMRKVTAAHRRFTVCINSVWPDYSRAISFLYYEAAVLKTKHFLSPKIIEQLHHSSQLVSVSTSAQQARWRPGTQRHFFQIRGGQRRQADLITLQLAAAALNRSPLLLFLFSSTQNVFLLLLTRTI